LVFCENSLDGAFLIVARHPPRLATTDHPPSFQLANHFGIGSVPFHPNPEPMLTAFYPILASRGSAFGRLLDKMGVPHWIIYVLLGGWVVFVLYRRFASSDD
jgi:hypothetical protein